MPKMLQHGIVRRYFSGRNQKYEKKKKSLDEI
jgi:hypothetical protein